QETRPDPIALTQFERIVLFHVSSFFRQDDHPLVSSTYRATCGTIPVDLLRMMQMTGAAFQTQVRPNEQATGPISHTPAKYRLHQLERLVICINLMVDPISAHYICSEFYQAFKEKWEKEIPSAIKSLSQAIDSCLTFFFFPQEKWIPLRTTNVIERLNKEFKRRIKSMEIVAGEHACYRLLAFISLKMEMNWRTMKVGKVRPNLPFYGIHKT
ncbi:MAG: transposase, partial [Thermodesulfovibrionales bacterium]|nr:transposase [Thermodesulfovibrionales bacterium]